MVRAVATQGLSNTLKFEQEETAKREKELIKAQKKLERAEKIKTLYTYLDMHAEMTPHPAQ